MRDEFRLLNHTASKASELIKNSLLGILRFQSSILEISLQGIEGSHHSQEKEVMGKILARNSFLQQPQVFIDLKNKKKKGDSLCLSQRGEDQGMKKR